MTGLWIALGLFIVFVLVIGIRYDRRQRGMRGTGGGGPDGKRLRLDQQTKADKWGGPGT